MILSNFNVTVLKGIDNFIRIDEICRNASGRYDKTGVMLPVGNESYQFQANLLRIQNKKVVLS